MQTRSRLALAAALVLAGSAAFANGKVQSVPPRAAPSPSQTSAFALPKPSGLTAPFPAGLNEGSGAAVSTDPVAHNSAPAPVDTAVNGNTVNSTGTFVNNGGFTDPFMNNGNNGSTVVGSNAAAATTVMGAGPMVAGPSQMVNAGAGGYSAVDIARSFYLADANHDGELTPAEFGRLQIRPLSFEQMDRNFDGVISRFEYDDATQ